MDIQKNKKDEMAAEKRILEAAIEEFTQKGYSAARLQSIADKAHISKSALHYYFRHKEKLFRLVLDKTIGRTLKEIYLDMSGHDQFIDKLEMGVRYYYKAIFKNIKVVKFLFLELNRNPLMIRDFLQQSNIREWIDEVNRELKREYEAGRIRKIQAEQLLLNIVSLCVFPHLSMGIACQVMNIDRETHKKMMMEREDHVLEFIKNALIIKET